MLTDGDFRSIRQFVERIVRDMFGSRFDYFVTGTVIKRDELKKLVWLEEFGDQPIPVVAFNYEVKYYDESVKGTNYGTSGSAAQYKTYVKKAVAEILVPKVGETVLVARELGIGRLPRCLGVIQGKGWIVREDE